MTIKYKAHHSTGEIEKVEAVRETKEFVWVLYDGRKNERMEKKETKHESFHDCWNHARDHLVRRAEQRVSDASGKLQSERENLAKVKNLKA